MPCVKETDKFYTIKSPPDYWRAGKHQMLGINVLREGHERLSLNDLLEFLKEHGVEPEKVLIGSSFTAFITD